MTTEHVLYKVFNQQSQLLYVDLSRHHLVRFNYVLITQSWSVEIDHEKTITQSFTSYDEAASVMWQIIRDEKPLYATTPQKLRANLL